MNCSENIKQFNKAVKVYMVGRTGEHERQIERCLQLLSSSSDLTVFDPGHEDTIQFYVNLHELMVALDLGTSLAWAAVACLKEACRNPSARRDLIHTYQFMPILTRFLASCPTRGRQLKLLKLMEELTYGVKISWQEAHLTRLITTLTNLITSDTDQELMTLSLSVLVNLCYKNLPAIYALMRSIDIKKFLKTVLKLHSHNESSKVQVCKLMIILKSVTGGLPDPDVKTYLKSVGPTLTGALRKGNSSLMRQTVSFYNEMSNSKPESVSHLQESTNVQSEIDCLLSAVPVDEQANAECIDILFEYLCQMVGSDCYDLRSLYPKLLALAFQWVCTEGVSTNALNLLTTITCSVSSTSDDYPEENEVMTQVLDVMNKQLSVILLLLDMDGRVQSNESYQRLTALLHLLTKMINIPTFTDKILSSLDPKALVLLQELSDKESTWLILNNELLLQKQVQFILSVALYVGSEDIKMRVLQLTTTPGFSHKCFEILAGCLAELNKLVIFSPFGSKKNEVPPLELGMTPMDLTPILTVTQEDHLNSLLDKFEHDSAKNGNSVTSAVMELYQFKVASMSQSIRKMQSSQEAADRRATDLQHNLALTTSEVSRLHHLLHSTQQNFEAAAKENSKLTNQISDIQAQANDLHNKHTQAIQTLRSKTRIIHDLTTELKEAQCTIASLSGERDQLSRRLQEELAAKQELQSRVSDLDGQLESTKQALSDCMKDLAHNKKEFECTSQKLDQTLRSKTRIIHDLTTELKEAQCTIASLSGERDQLSRRLQEELAAKQELQSRVSDLDGQLESTKQALSDCMKDLAHNKKEFECTSQKLDQTLRSKTRIIHDLTTELKEAQCTIASLSGERDQLSRRLQEELAAKQELQSRVSDLDGQLESTKQALSDCMKDLAHNKKEFECTSQKLDQTLRSKTRIIHDLTTELKEAQCTIASLSGERDQLSRRLQEELAAKQELQSRVSDLDGQLESTKQALSDCMKDLAHNKKEFECTSQKLDQLKKDYLSQTTEYSKLEKAKAEVDAEAAELNKQLNIISQLAMKRKVDK